jgi:hypothetical protein
VTERTATISLKARNSASGVIGRVIESLERLRGTVDTVGSMQGLEQAADRMDRLRRSATALARSGKDLRTGLSGMARGVTSLTSSLTRVERGVAGLAGGGGGAALSGGSGGGAGGIDGLITGISEGGEVVEEFAQGLETLAGPLWPLKALALGVGAGFAVFAGGLVLAGKAVGTFLEKTAAGEAATKRWSKAHDELVASIGGSIIGYQQAGGALDILAARMQRVAKWYRAEVAGTVFGFAKEIAGGIVTLTASAAGSVGGLLTTAVEGIRHFANIYLNTVSLMLAGVRRLFNSVREMGRNFGLDFSGDNDMSRMDTFLSGEVRALEEGAKNLYEKTGGWLVGIRGLTRTAQGDLAVLQNQISGLQLGTFGGLKKDGDKKDKDKDNGRDFDAAPVEALEGGGLFGLNAGGLGALMERGMQVARRDRWLSQFGEGFKKQGEELANFLYDFHTPWIQLKYDVDAANKSMSALANQGLQSTATAFTDLVKAVAGGASLGKSLLAWGSQMGDLFVQIGLGYLFTGIGQIAITSGDGFGAIAAGSALAGIGLVLSALTSRASKDGAAKKGGGVAGAVNDAFSSAVDRILAENRRKEQPIINNFVIEGERMDQPIRNSLGRLQAQGQLALQVIP